MSAGSISLCLILAFTAVFGGGQGAYAQDEAAGPLNGFIREALENHPGIREAYHQWKAAEYTIKSVRGLPDPRISYGFFGESIETRTGPQEQKFGLSQKIPFPGKRGLRAKVQAKEARIRREKYHAIRSEVIKDVRIAFYDLYWMDRALEITREEKTILEDTEKVARRRYESTLSSQQDVIKLQVELSKIIERLSLIRQNRQSTAARLNRLLNRHVNTPIDTLKQIKTREVSYTLDELMAKSQDSRQELRAADLAVEKSEFEKSLAAMDYLPDFTFGGEYIEIGGGTTSSLDDGKDAWVATVSLNIPVWFGKNAG
ncbi:MAG: TolC family protein, partial [Candidatus Omnitrophica bacterium]|nr:TolC family protein [Candidatus Omnitrophota bacterium]